MSNETPQDWRDRVLNTKSGSFCGAKWYNATIWLGNGGTTSCHHPPPHEIDLEEIRTNPRALHNTQYKKLVRKNMQEGVRPKECEYCWKIEDLGQEYVSDRFYKSAIYTEDELATAAATPWDQDVNLINLEIAFDSNCNYACSYCNASFSTKWGHDIKQNGVYSQMKSDGAGAYYHNGGWAQPYGVKNTSNPYVEAFWAWWESDLHHTLRQLRVTGGEATMSHDFWKLVAWYEANPTCKVELSLNTNLGIKKAKLDRLIELSKKIDFSLFTSNESMGGTAEYIRDGLVWDEWKSNLERAATEGRFKFIHVMMTINALCLESLDRFMEYVFDLRERTGVQIDISFNILRFPSFQSITTLPLNIREERAAHYRNWITTHGSRMRDWERDGLDRTIAYISEVADGHWRSADIESRQHDFASFYAQYDTRRGKSFLSTFAGWSDLTDWIGTIQLDPTLPAPSLGVGNANHWGRPMVDEVMRIAKENNWI